MESRLKRSLSDGNIQKQTDNSSSDTRPEKRLAALRDQHAIGSGLNPQELRDQRAGTNEASSSGSDSKASFSRSDWERMRWQDSNDKLLLLADRCTKSNNDDLGKKCYQYIIDNFESKPNLDDPTIPQALSGLATIYLKQKRPIDAKALCEASISYLAHTPETKDIDFAPAMKSWADAYLEQGKDRQAKVIYKSVFSIYKQRLGKDDPKAAGALKDLAQVYQKQGRFSKAKAAYEYVYPIYEKNFGKDHLRTKEVQQNLRDLPQKAGKVDKKESIENLMDKKLPNILLNYIKHHRRVPDLCDPKLITDNTLARNLLDDRPIIQKATDRLKVRELVKEKIGEEYLPEILHETDDPSTIPFETLPDKFVIKSTQGSGRVIVVQNKLFDMDKEKIIKECESWLDPANDYYKKTGGRVHKQSDKRIIVEGFIDDESGLTPNDYKFFTYKGEPRYLEVDNGRYEEHTLDMIDVQNGEKIPLKHDWIQSSSGDIPLPPHFEKMQELSQELGKIVEDFARVDWYATKKQIYLGEITVSPGGATWDFEPAMSNRIFGEPWEFHNKTSRELSGPSSEVHDIISQINRGILKVAWEGKGYTHKKGPIMKQS